MISTLEVWAGSIAPMYLDEFYTYVSSKIDDSAGRIDITYESGLTGAKQIEKRVKEELAGFESSFFDQVVLVVHIPSGAPSSAWFESLLETVEKSEASVRVAMYSKGDIQPTKTMKELGKKHLFVLHDYTLPTGDVWGFGAAFSEHFADKGITLTEKQGAQIAERADMDMGVVCELYPTLLAAGQSAPDHVLTDDMIKTVLGDKFGLTNVFDFGKKMDTKDGAQISRFIWRIVKQNNSTAACMQLLTQIINDYRALIAFRDGCGIQEVIDKTKRLKDGDSVAWEMKEGKARYLQRSAYNLTRDQQSQILTHALYALMALKGGDGFRIGRHGIMMKFAADITRTLNAQTAIHRATPSLTTPLNHASLAKTLAKQTNT